MANKPRFDGDFTITDVENIFNQWEHIPFPNTKAIAFNGVPAESLLDVADANNLSFGNGLVDSKLSFAAWIKPIGTLSHDFAILAKAQTGGGTVAEYLFYIQRSFTRMTCMLLDHNVGQAIYAQDLGGIITLGQWNHVCATYDGTSLPGGISLYVNGQPTAASPLTAGAYTAMENTAASFTMGRKYENATTGVAEGIIDEVAVFSKELSAAEVVKLYNSGFVLDLNTFAAASDLVSWWRMGDKATGASPDFTIPDQAGSNNAVMSAFLGDSTSGVVAGAPEQPPSAGTLPLSLATKGILFRNRSKPYLVSNGGNPDDIIT